MSAKEAEACAADIEREETMALVEETKPVVVAEVAVVEEAGETSTATATILEEVVTALMEAEEVAEGTTTGTTTTSIRGINNTPSCISNNKYLRQFLCLIPCPVPDHSSRATAWTATPIRPVAMSTVVNGTTKGSNNGRDQPHLVQRVPSR